MRTTFAWILAGCLVATTAVGCSTGAEDDAAATDAAESELRAMTPSEIVGSLAAYGDTVGPIHYSETPRYRALKFVGTAGETARFTVMSPGGGRAAAWILGPKFQTLKTARAATAGKNLEIQHKFASSGTYYLALRDADQEEADFWVSVTQVLTGSTPPASNDPFDPSSCTGAPMTQAEAAALFAAGTKDVEIGDYVVTRRSRACNAVTGCGAWGASTTMLGSGIGSLSANLELRGAAHLVVEGASIQLRLGGGSNDGSRCSAVGGAQTCGSYSYVMGYQWGGSGGMYPTVVNLSKANYQPLALSGTLTKSCLRLTDVAKTADKEEEYVAFARVSPKAPPPPAVCPANQTQMECGSRAASGMKTCCQAGLRTCPQSGCDCWAACN